MATQKFMDIKEFCDEGYLHEINRRVLHPLGLAIEVIQNEDGTYSFGKIWDRRDEAAGITFDNLNHAKMKNIYGIESKRLPIRKEKLGYIIQRD